LRSVASEYGTSPRTALKGVFDMMRRTARRKKLKRIYERFANHHREKAGPAFH